MDDRDEYDVDEYQYEFELLNSSDMKIITLACTASRELDPQEYAQALIAYAERILTVSNMSEIITEMN